MCSIFQEIFAIIDQILISGGLSTRQELYETLRFFLYFLIS